MAVQKAMSKNRRGDGIDITRLDDGTTYTARPGTDDRTDLGIIGVQVLEAAGTSRKKPLEVTVALLRGERVIW